MENKYLTLQTIYNLVKNDAHPTSSVLHPNEIIVRQQCPWDEIVSYLNELKAENLINILQVSPAVIHITEQGFQFVLSILKSRKRDLRFAA
jgi:predicted transcriptional regulator